MTERTAGIEEPKTTGGNYTKLKKDGDTKLRILTSPIMGYEYFNTDDRPVRSRNEITNPRDIKPDTFTGKAGKVKQFWAMTVWNYDEECIQIWEITQQALKQQLRALAKDTDYGDPRTYDIKVNRTGEKQETKYMIKPLGKSEFTNQEAINQAKSVRMEELYDGGDPFMPF